MLEKQQGVKFSNFCLFPQCSLFNVHLLTYFDRILIFFLPPKKMGSNAQKIFIFSLILIITTAANYTVTKQRVDRPLPYTIQYFLTNSQGKRISCWTDIDIGFNFDTLNAIIEIPKQNTAKMQMVKQYPNHPVSQDIRTNKYNKKIELRHYAIPLPLVNYGFIPQTWEQNIQADAKGYYGDNDPIDVVDLSSKDRSVLDIVRVKVLGAFCLIDEGELDWKVFVMDVEEAQRLNINEVQDLPAGRVQEIVNWFRVYKTYEGKPQNTIGFGGKIFDRIDTLGIVFDTNVQFKRLMADQGEEYVQRREEFNL